MTYLRCLRALGASALLMLAGCWSHPASTASGPQASPTPAATAVPTPTQKPTSRPISTAPVFIVASPSARPVPIVSAPHDIVSVAPATNRKVAYVPPNAAPEILRINISSVVIHSGDTVRGNVTTTSNVSNVDVHISEWAMPLPHPRPGYFEGSGVIPQLPFFMKGNYTLQVIARTAGGQSVERDIPISVR
jgi:hypothetical protein